MKKVFVSYHHAEPDSKLANTVVSTLRQRGYDPFIDVDIEIGERWAQRIDQEIRQSSVFIVLLSETSIYRDMVRTEVQIAYELYMTCIHNPENGGAVPFMILPVRVGYEGDLPYDLAGYLGALQYVLWRNDADTADIASRIADAVGGRSLQENRILDAIRTVDQRKPQPVADILLETGMLRDSPFYIARDSEDEILQNVNANGTTTIVHGARQMGKSSLLARIHEQAAIPTIYLDLQLADSSRFASLDALCKYVAAMLRREIPGSASPSELWDEFLGPTQCLTDYVESIALSTGESLMLLIDEIDRVAEFPDCLDFFVMLRAWHDRRAMNVNWQNLNIVIAHSSDPNAWIEQKHQSPFNVGLRKTLADFTDEQMEELSCRHGLALPEGHLRRLMALIQGHPYLTRLALYEFSVRNRSIDYLEASAGEESGPFADHLRHYFFKLKEHPVLTVGLKRCVSGLPIENDDAFRRLYASGLVVGSTAESAKIRCDLYRRYFKTRL